MLYDKDFMGKNPSMGKDVWDGQNTKFNLMSGQYYTNWDSWSIDDIPKGDLEHPQSKT